MRPGAICFWGGLLFLFCCGLAKAQEEDLAQRDVLVQQALDAYREPEWDRSQTIEEALTDFETKKDDLARDRDLKVRQALELLEQAQVSEVVIEEHDEENEELIPERSWLESHINLRGQLRNEIAARTHKLSQLTKVRNQISLTATGELTPSVRYRVSGRGHYDAVYDLQNNYSDSARTDQRFEGELRDTYIDYSAGNWDFRVGKQQIVWGEAIAMFVADVVNGKDMREYSLPDFDSIRIPEWGVNAEYTNGRFNSQLIFLPGIELDKFPMLGAEFAFPPPVPLGTPYRYVDAKQPKDGFENSKIGARLNYLWGGLDTGLFYLHSWTPSPVAYRTIESGEYIFDPQYRRLDTYGATFSKEISEIVYKGDFVFTKNDYCILINDDDSDGVSRCSRIDYLLGADMQFFNSLDFSFQYSQRIVFNFNEDVIGQVKYSNTFLIMVGRSFLNDKLSAEFTALYELEAPDFLYRPKARYKLSDNWQISVGADIFAGNSSGLLGYFRNQSRVYSELVYKF